MPTAPDSPELARPAKRGGRMAELAAVGRAPVRPVLGGAAASGGLGCSGRCRRGVSGTPQRHGAGAAGAE